MTDSPATRATLLLRLRDADDSDAWSQFVRDYGPMLYRFIRGRGLQDADAVDLVQDVMRAVGGAIGRLDYDKDRGGFRAWLFTITRNKLYTFLEKRARTEQGRGDTSTLEQLNQRSNDHDRLEELFEREHQRQLAAKAIEIIKPRTEPTTWEAFQLTAIHGMSAQRAADQIGMSKGAVYVARSRVTAKLRDEIKRLLQEEDH